MPAIRARTTIRSLMVGVDGRRGGWVAATLDLSATQLSLQTANSFHEILNGPANRAAMIMVDMPIGCADAGRRCCEQEARALLKGKRAASVFATPRRPMLAFDDYAAANEWGKQQGQDGGGGLSKQAWMITPKIREIDALITPVMQTHVSEGHPEVAFYRLNGLRPCEYSKRTAEGKKERRLLLRQHGISTVYELYKSLKATLERSEHLGEDDVYDACALALTAKARLDGDAICLGDGARDVRGLVMEIWG